MKRANEVPPTLAPFVVISVALGGFAMSLFQPVEATCPPPPPASAEDDALARAAWAMTEPTSGPESKGCTLSVTVAGEDDAVNTTLALSLMGSEGTLQTIRAVPRADGLHRFTDLVEGTYHLTATAPSKPLASAAPFTCNADAERSFVRLNYAPKAVRFSGRVLGFAGRTPADAEVLVQQPAGHRDGLAGIAHIPVRADGSFEVLLPPGRHTLLATAPFHAPLTQEMTLAETSATVLRLKHQPTVAGRVIDERGVPLANADVFVSVGLDPKARPLAVKTDHRGAFSVPAHSSSSVRISARSKTHVGILVLPPIKTIEGVRGVEVIARPGRSVSGYVQTRTGRVKPHAKVRFRVPSKGLTGVVVSDAEGRFSVSGLPGDDVDLWAEGSAVGAWGGAVATREQPRVLLTWVPPAYKRR